MVSITATARANLLSLIGANEEQDKVGSQLVSGKRVQSVEDNAFSFFQSRGLDNRIETLSTINDRISIGTRATEQAQAAGKKISKNLNTVKGLLDDIKSKGAAGQVEAFTVSGAPVAGVNSSIFNRLGTAANPITENTTLADSTDIGAAGISGFAKNGLTAASDLAGFLNNGTNANAATTSALGTATAVGTDSLISVGGFTAGDTIRIGNGTQNVFVTVLAQATAFTAGTQTGASAGTAIEVKSLDDLKNVISGFQRDGTTALAAAQTTGFTASIDTTGGAGARFKIANNAGTAATANFDVFRNATGVPAATTLFGGTAATTTFAPSATQSAAASTLAIAAATAPIGISTINAGLTVGDVVGVKIGAGAVATNRSIFAKVVTAFSGASGTQAGDGLSEATAIEVRTLGDLAKAFNGKKTDGIANINADGIGSNAFGVSVDEASNGSKLKVSAGVASSFTIKQLNGGTNNTAVQNLFGGTAATVDFAQGALTGVNRQATTIAAQANTGALLQNDVISFDVGAAGAIRTLFVKVVGNYSGAGGAQAGNGVGNGVGTDSPLEVRTIGDLRNAINGLDKAGAALADQGFVNSGARASFDGTTGAAAAPTTGRFALTSAAPLRVNVDRFGIIAANSGVAAAIFGTNATSTNTGGTAGVGPTAGRSVLNVGSVTNNAAKEARLSAAAAYKTALRSIAGFVSDAQVNGINLLTTTAASPFKLQLSENVEAKFELRSTLGGATGTANPLTVLGFTVNAAGDADEGSSGFATNGGLTGVDVAITKLDNAITSLAGRDTELDVIKAVISQRQSFNKDIITSLGDLSTDLTAVNQEEASAQAQAASFSSNAALKFLGVSSQRASQLLQIF